ncbi:hypothetical protein TGAM01_v205736 [Trichoderma gamsii]|uniref:Teneurin-like YD-shell domain-containing protein n=1 Tax=Trichoderma gamsii TaxID=398673 RepID=A0A2P4ZMC2_9HYPO|nr:hypothetical protein TGAM01_v205736 [Trichoderma gamsii]PON25442.1 hypothetical protein TGAM01_v205736 [Trichoderma gamsii]
MDRKLTLHDGSSYNTSLSYDWQDQEVKKILPDGAVLELDYRGSEIISRTLSSGPGSAWSLKAETLKYSPFGRPEKLSLLSTESKMLVNDEYFYNALDQITREHESMSESVIEYSYSGKRLAASKSSSGGRNHYTYDSAGNLAVKRGTEIAYFTGRALAMKDGEYVFDISYDTVGRVSHRVTDGLAMAFKYDSFGSLQFLEELVHGTSIELVSDFEGEMFHRKHSDGSSDLVVSDEFSIHSQPDDNLVLGSVSRRYESVEAISPFEGSRLIDIKCTDTKGNVTHTFNGQDVSICETPEYDDFGLLNSDTVEGNTNSTYEGNYFGKATGLVNFGGRWYDPLVGRFTTPDDILNIDSLIRTDGLNRYAFENNDPINNCDPTGHWSLSSIAGPPVVGAGAPLVAAAVGALGAGGAAGIMYSIENSDEDDTGKFWGGLATTVAFNAGIGAATGAISAVATPARIASATGRIFSRAALGSKVLGPLIRGVARGLVGGAKFPVRLDGTVGSIESRTVVI